MNNYIEQHALISDFKEISTFSYKDYVDIKGYPYLSVENLSANKISKTFDTLFINNAKFKLNSLSINDVINIMLEYTPDIVLSVYEEHPEDYLNVSALFLADFSSYKAIKYHTAESIVNSKVLEKITDSFNNKYSLQDMRVYNEFGDELEYYKREESIRITTNNERYNIVCLYKATDLKLNILLEYPVTSLDQLTLNPSPTGL